MKKNPDCQKGNIIVVDDTPANLRLLTNLLTEQGYDVRPVPNGRLALSGVQAIPPDLILLDIKMPEMDGYEVCRQLKKDAKNQKIPVIFISALDDVVDKVKAFSVGGIDYVTKPFQAEEVLARVHTHLELKRHREEIQRSYEIIKVQQEQIEEELEQARQTQLAILPRHPPQIPNVKITSRFVPAQQVGGDIYDIFELKEEKYGIMIADATGHGIPAALISCVVFGIFKDIIRTEDSTETTIRQLNQALGGQLPEAKFASMFFGIYDSIKQTLLFTNAGHPPGLVIRSKTNTIFQLTTQGSPIGILSNDQNSFEEKEFQLTQGDKMLLFTDGLIEVMNDENRILGINALSLFLEKHAQLSIIEILNQVFDYCLSYSGQDYFRDDCTMIGLEIIA